MTVVSVAMAINCHFLRYYYQHEEFSAYIYNNVYDRFDVVVF